MATQTTVSTDAQDYAPGSWAEITATGFEPGSTVNFQVQHAGDPGADGIWGTLDDVIVDLGGEGHEAWSIVDGSELDLDGTANGAVVTSWYVNPDDSLNWHFLLTAVAANQQTASAGFTDAAGSTNKVYQHWADGDAATQSAAEWNNNILNANKSDYFEGEVIPHVFIYKASSQVPLVNGQSYSFNVTYNYYQQNTDALGFDYLTTFDISRTPGQLGVTNPAITPTLDSSFANGGGFTSFGGVSQGIYTVDANITNVSGITTLGSGTLDHKVTITFTYTGATTTNGVAEIYYGLHVAGPSPTEKGASAWTGGSLQTTVDIGGSGATSIQLSPAAIIAGSISGVKFNDLNGNGIRDAGESGIDGVIIYLDLNNDGQLDENDVSQITASGGRYTFSVTPDANKSTTDNDPYIVREVVPDGWMQTTVNPLPIIISALHPTELDVNFGNMLLLRALHIEKEVDKTTVDAAGTVLNYTIAVKNTGNVDLTHVMLTDDFASAMLDSGDTDGDSVLDVSEIWIYKASHTVTQGEMNTGEAIVNVATVDTEQTDPQSDDASTSVTQTPGLTITKDVDKTNVNSTGTLTYTIALDNTGNVDLTGVNLQDLKAYGLTITSGDDGDGVLETNETWTYKAYYDVTQADLNSGEAIVNVATVDTDQTTEQSDDASTTITYRPVSALIAPTSTTVNQYLDGSALSFQQYYDYQGGVIQYSTSLKTGKISQTNPGVLFYFTGASGSIKVADGQTTEQLSVTIDQTVSLKSGTPITGSLTAVQNNIQLYQVVDANQNGKYDAGETVNTLSSKSYSITTLNGDITLNFTGMVGSFYVASVKYDTSAVIGTSIGKNAATWPTVNYQFDTMFKSTMIETYAGGVDLAPKKPAPMLLEGEQGNGAKAVNDSQIKHVINAAICWWEDHGISAEQLGQLKSATVEIADLGEDAQGWWLGNSSGSLITIDDDAADHGWSLGLGDVAHNKVDLFSVLVHEMGHLLGKSDEDMGNTLAVGERMLPEISVMPPEGDDDQDSEDDQEGGDDRDVASDEDHSNDHDEDHSGDHSGAHGGHGVPNIEHMLTLVGSTVAEQQMHLHMS